MTQSILISAASTGLVRPADRRVHTTPNATMTTLASPVIAGTTALSLWRVELPAGASGPLHRMSSEQVWTVDAGSATCTVDGQLLALESGNTLRLAADVPRQFTTAEGATFTVCGFADAIARTDENGDGVVPPWIQ